MAVVFLFILGYDAWKGFWFADPATGTVRFGVGIGSLVLLANVICLAGYTLGCHSMRHLLGGFRDQFSKRPAFRLPYRCSTCLNDTHHRWAWLSLLVVAFSDIYIRLCSMGVWSDLRLL
ncbi:MAG: hypothetical protein ACRENB_00535 [Gemmatimonadales bacterium]